MTQLKMLSADDKLTEIRRLYFATSRQSIENDLTRALDLLKSMPTEDERERATVYMEGLAEMAKDWTRDSTPKGVRKAGAPGGHRQKPGAPAAKKTTPGPGTKRPEPKATGGPAKSGGRAKKSGAKKRG
ncbi:MAG: hypothetical protein ABL982_10135 [Vicinamibacterales bacterium]